MAISSSHTMIADLTLFFRKKGFCLVYQDFEIIDQWVQLARGKEDAILLILEDILSKRKATHSLKSIHKSVCLRIDAEMNETFL